MNDVLGTARERRDRIDGRDLGDAFLVSFLALRQAGRQLAHPAGGGRLGGGAQVRVAHRHALAIERQHQDVARRARLRGPRQPARQIEVGEVGGGATDDRLHLTLRHGRTRVRRQHRDGLVEGPLGRLFRGPAPNAERVPLRRQIQRRVQREQRLVPSRAMPRPRHLDRAEQRLQRARAVARVRPLDALGPDHRARGRRLRPEIQMRLQELPHQLAAFPFEEAFQIAVRHARSIARLEPTHQSCPGRLRLRESILRTRRSSRRRVHRGGLSPDLWSSPAQRCHTQAPTRPSW